MFTSHGILFMHQHSKSRVGTSHAGAEKAPPGLVAWCGSVSLGEHAEDILIFKSSNVKSGLLKMGNKTETAHIKLENILNLTFFKLLIAKVD